MKKRIKIQGIIIFLTVISTILLSKVVFPYWKKEHLDEFLDALGIGLVLYGFLFRIAARGYKEEKSGGGNKLVTDGPYHLIRHPMYFGTLLIGMGIIAVLLALWTFPLFLMVYFLIYIPQIKREEDILFKRFGQDYKNYCNTTPKYFPKIHHLLDINSYVGLKLSWLKKELSSLIAVIIAILAIETWQDVKLFGYHEFPKELLELGLIILVFITLIILSIKKEIK